MHASGYICECVRTRTIVFHVSLHLLLLVYMCSRCTCIRQKLPIRLNFSWTRAKLTSTEGSGRRNSGRYLDRVRTNPANVPMAEWQSLNPVNPVNPTKPINPKADSTDRTYEPQTPKTQKREQTRKGDGTERIQVARAHAVDQLLGRHGWRCSMYNSAHTSRRGARMGGLPATEAQIQLEKNRVQHSRSSATAADSLDTLKPSVAKHVSSTAPATLYM